MRKPMIATDYRVAYETLNIKIEDYVLAEIFDEYGVYWYGEDDLGGFLPEWAINANDLRHLLHIFSADNDYVVFTGEKIKVSDIIDSINSILKYGYVDNNGNIHIMW